MAVFKEESVAEALERSLRNNKRLRMIHAGPVAAARGLARRVDYLLANEGLDESGKLDNVSVPIFLKYCVALGLTLDREENQESSPRQKAKPSVPANNVLQFRKK